MSLPGLLDPELSPVPLRKSLQLVWITVGVGIIVALHLLIHPTMAITIGGAFQSFLPDDLSIYAYRAVIAVVSFFVGSFAAAVFSPGDTVREGWIAGGIAALIIVVRDALQWPEQSTIVGGVVTLLIGVVTALAGSRLGEHVQGNNLDKERERRGHH
jgi:hypothetical protein